jgi:hypothetical protein
MHDKKQRKGRRENKEEAIKGDIKLYSLVILEEAS